MAEVLPELVVNDAAEQPFTVRYHQLTPLLLAEVQRLERERVEERAVVQALIEKVEALQGKLEQLHDSQR